MKRLTTRELKKNKEKYYRNQGFCTIRNKQSSLPLNLELFIKECRGISCYELLGEIDEGTFGRVYRARDRYSRSLFALKSVKLGKKSDTLGYPITSIREINILLTLKHPNIVTIYEIIVGSTTTEVYVVLELMDHDLKSLMENMYERYFTISSIKNISKQLILGVTYLHSNWILHRDIKTSNILYNNRGETKLCDFGLARRYNNHPEKYSRTVITPK
jgi:cell division cycle 2-like protein